jgi:hypothetical protein
MRDHFPTDPLMHFCNNYVEVHCLVKNNRLASLVGDKFMSYVYQNNQFLKSLYPEGKTSGYLRSDHPVHCYMCCIPSYLK